MDFTDMLILGVIGGVVIAVVQGMISSGKKTLLDEKIGLLEEFSASQKVLGVNGDSGIAIDEDRKKICFMYFEMGEASLSVYTYKDILSAEIFEDGETITRTIRRSQVGGALLGGLVLGGVGALVGSLTGKKSSADKVKNMELRIIVNDTKRPFHDVAFMNVEGKKHGFIYNQAMEQARYWHSLTEVLIKHADDEDKQIEISEPHFSNDKANVSIADELEKLNSLKNSGILTDEEFLTQKEKLLAL